MILRFCKVPCEMPSIFLTSELLSHCFVDCFDCCRTYFSSPNSCIWNCCKSSRVNNSFIIIMHWLIDYDSKVHGEKEGNYIVGTNLGEIFFEYKSVQNRLKCIGAALLRPFFVLAAYLFLDLLIMNQRGCLGMLQHGTRPTSFKP